MWNYGRAVFKCGIWSYSKPKGLLQFTKPPDLRIMMRRCRKVFVIARSPKVRRMERHVPALPAAWRLLFFYVCCSGD